MTAHQIREANQSSIQSSRRELFVCCWSIGGITSAVEPAFAVSCPFVMHHKGIFFSLLYRCSLGELGKIVLLAKSGAEIMSDYFLCWLLLTFRKSLKGRIRNVWICKTDCIDLLCHWSFCLFSSRRIGSTNEQLQHSQGRSKLSSGMQQQL